MFLSVSQGDTNEESLGDVETVNDNIDILSSDQTELDAEPTTEVEVPTLPAIQCTHTHAHTHTYINLSGRDVSF